MAFRPIVKSSSFVVHADEDREGAVKITPVSITAPRDGDTEFLFGKGSWRGWFANRPSATTLAEGTDVTASVKILLLSSLLKCVDAVDRDAPMVLAAASAGDTCSKANKLIEKWGSRVSFFIQRTSPKS